MPYRNKREVNPHVIETLLGNTLGEGFSVSLTSGSKMNISGNMSHVYIITHKSTGASLVLPIMGHVGTFRGEKDIGLSYNLGSNFYAEKPLLVEGRENILSSIEQLSERLKYSLNPLVNKRKTPGEKFVSTLTNKELDRGKYLYATAQYVPLSESPSSIKDMFSTAAILLTGNKYNALGEITNQLSAGFYGERYVNSVILPTRGDATPTVANLSYLQPYRNYNEGAIEVSGKDPFKRRAITGRRSLTEPYRRVGDIYKPVEQKRLPSVMFGQSEQSKGIEMRAAYPLAGLVGNSGAGYIDPNLFEKKGIDYFTVKGRKVIPLHELGGEASDLLTIQNKHPRITLNKDIIGKKFEANETITAGWINQKNEGDGERIPIKMRLGERPSIIDKINIYIPRGDAWDKITEKYRNDFGPGYVKRGAGASSKFIGMLGPALVIEKRDITSVSFKDLATKPGTMEVPDLRIGKENVDAIFQSKMPVYTTMSMAANLEPKKLESLLSNIGNKGFRSDIKDYFANTEVPDLNEINTIYNKKLFFN